jgi:hypothetical protein
MVNTKYFGSATIHINVSTNFVEVTPKKFTKIYTCLQLMTVVCITWKALNIFRTNNDYVSYVSKFGYYVHVKGPSAL